MRREALYQMYASRVPPCRMEQPEESQSITERQTVMSELRLHS